MSLLERLSAPGEVLVANAPPGLDAWLIAELLGEIGQASLLQVARDDAHMAQLAEAVAFFAPTAEIVLLPAWDCLPYDRVGPHRDIVAQRIDALSRLIEQPTPRAPRLVLTTINGLLQRLPPRDLLEGRVLRVEIGQELAQEDLIAFLVRNSYLRTGTVSEPGEYAQRGGILDLFPPGEDQPLRLDFFGDELESLRRFDPLSQRTTEDATETVLRPVSEVILDEAAIERFRTGYREIFGGTRGDPLYEAVSAGRLHPGMEHWLPLFFERLETLFDYLPDAPVGLDHQVPEAAQARFETIEDFYQARKQLEGQPDAGGWPYRPLATDALYLSGEELSGRLEARPVARFWPFAAPEAASGVFDAGGRARHDFSAARTAADGGLFDAVKAAVEADRAAGKRVLLTAHSEGSRDRLIHLCQEHQLSGLAKIAAWPEAEDLAVAILGLEQGFATDRLSVISEQDVLGERLARPSAQKKRPDNFLTEVSAIETGDLVVHVEHGIGRYEGLEAIDVGGAPHDCLKLIYHSGDKLFLPVVNIEVLSRFGSEDAGVELDKLGQAGWQTRKSRVKARIRAIAKELIKVAAARQLKSADVMQPAEGLYDEFCARFPYPETDDQLRAIDQTLDDLAVGRPMDRLVCGDVGFGKTEVALRAAFVAVMTGRQVAVVVPTTLLARQHYRTFIERFRGLPVKVGQLSRLVNARDTALTKSGLKDGTLDIVIGTHALLGKSIQFRDLGLLIVDEEQHFGVKQKERLKQLREDVHVLTLTATPIPRTLQLALSGVKEMSLIATPPVDRLAVRTFVLPFDPVIVREAILREHYRGGQVFYVCPRIEHIPDLTERLEKLVPEIKVGVAHGQLPPAELERVMTAFVDRQYDLLLSTNIIESGLDIPSANTMIVHRSDMFGLAQLYQLRGRIGRSKQRGYAYLTLRPGRLLTAAAEKRLEVMQTLDTLGAGFTLASHDLDIRGAGNLLGEEQSGHIKEVGIELYQQMLEDAVADARAGGGLEDGEAADAWTPQIGLGTPVLIPESYVTDLNVRLGLYRRVSTLVDQAEIEAFAAELIDRFGPLPHEVDNLLEIIAIKQLCRDAGVGKIDAGPKGAVVAFHAQDFANPMGLIAHVQRNDYRLSLRPDNTLVCRELWENPKTRLSGVRALLGELAEIAKAGGTARRAAG
ncbi:MAG: transcription-repair coupling factor [Pseudomonadota bacterium]